MDAPALDDQADDDAGQAAADLDRQDIRLLRYLPPVLAELRAIEDPDARVRYEIGRTQIAILERLRQIARRDLAGDRA